jgi:hypothetical protein
MATWLDIVGKPSDLADSNHRSAAIFLVKNEDATVQDPPTPAEQLLPQSKMSAAKDILSAAASRVSSWVHRKARPVQQQDMHGVEAQTADQMRSVDTKRVPRSQRLAKQAEELAGAGMIFLLALRPMRCSIL